MSVQSAKLFIHQAMACTQHDPGVTSSRGLIDTDHQVGAASSLSLGAQHVGMDQLEALSFGQADVRVVLMAAWH